MRKLKLQIQITLDGYIAGSNGEMDFMVWNWDEELKNYVKDITEQVDCIVLGRKLAEGFIPYWAANPEQEGADKINNTPKIVFTKSLKKSDPTVINWPNTTLANIDLVDEIVELKRQKGNDIMVYGGAGFVSSLIKHRLIDDFHLLINPTAIGQGMPIFQELDGKQDLMLVKSKSFDCGIVVLNYQLK